MNYKFEVEKLKSWKVYYTNMYRKTSRNVYYDNLKKIMFKFMSKIVLSYINSEIGSITFKSLDEVRDEMSEQADEIRQELKILNLALAC